jgi:hypothetical protein
MMIVNFCSYSLRIVNGGVNAGQQGEAKPGASLHGDDLLRLTVPVGLKRAGREMRMLVENADDQTAADPGLLRILARVHHIQARLIQNPKLSAHDIAREERVSAAYLYSLLRHHHGHHQWPKTAATHRPDIDAPDAAAAGRLG